MRKYIIYLFILLNVLFLHRAIAQPVVRIDSVKALSCNTARMYAFVTTKGGWTVNSYGFIFDTLPMPTRATGAKIIRVGTSCPDNGGYNAINTASAGGLMISGKTYYVRAYVARYSPTVDTVFSSPVSVFIPFPTPPICKMDSVKNIRIDSATFYGQVATKNDAYSFISKGFIYSTSMMPTHTNSAELKISGNITSFPDRWYSIAKNLLSGQKYYARCFTIFKYVNSAATAYDTVYSDTLSFKTLDACGSVPTRVNVDSIDVTSARIFFTPGFAQRNWQIDYGFAGHTPGQGTLMATNKDTIKLTGLIGGRAYSVYVRAICSNTYSDWSIIKAFVTLPYPCAPIGDIYTNEVYYSSAKISWNPGSVTQKKWEVLFAKKNETFPATGTIITNIPIFSPIGLTPQTEYKLKIRALCNDLYSDWSNEHYFTTTVNSLEDEIIQISEKVLIYPNPTKGIINFKANENEKISKIEIWSLFGELIHSYQGLPKSISLERYSKGLYLVKIFSDKTVQIEKIVVN